MATSMDKLLRFLNRLENGKRRYHLELSPDGSAIRVNTWMANERWEVDFGAATDVEVEIFRNADHSTTEGEELLDRLFQVLRKAWQDAAADLGVRFEAPFFLSAPDGRRVECAGHLPDFGGPMGALIVSMEDSDEADTLGDALGYYVSGLNPRCYEYYDRTLFVETLNDWGWFGEDAPPTWFAGALGRHGGR